MQVLVTILVTVPKLILLGFSENPLFLVAEARLELARPLLGKGF